MYMLISEWDVRIFNSVWRRR